MVSRPILNSRQSVVLQIRVGRDPRLSKQSLKKSARLFTFGQVNIHKHDAGCVQHQAAVRVSSNDRRGLARSTREFAQDLFTKGTVRVIRGMSRGKIFGMNTSRELMSGVLGE